MPPEFGTNVLPEERRRRSFIRRGSVYVRGIPKHTLFGEDDGRVVGSLDSGNPW